MLSISSKGATNKLPCQFDAANIVALVATIFATSVGKKKESSYLHFASQV